MNASQLPDRFIVPVRRYLRLLLLWVTLGSASFAAEPAATTNAAFDSALTEIAKTQKQIPFKEVIRATTHHRILDYDAKNPAHAELHRKLAASASLAAEKARAAGVFAARPNEAGNHMEAFVKAELQAAGLNARTPVTATGGAQSAGYPDIEILGDPPCYLELKTYSAATADTTQRSFYYSPSGQPKVTRDALHLLLAYEVIKVDRDGKTSFVPVHWKLITLQDLKVDLKLEFNQSNRGLYGKEAAAALMSEGAMD